MKRKSEGIILLGFDSFTQRELKDLYTKEISLFRIFYNEKADINRALLDQPFRQDLYKDAYSLLNQSKVTDLHLDFLTSDNYNRYLIRCLYSSTRGRVNDNNFDSQSIIEISNTVLLFVTYKIYNFKLNVNLINMFCSYHPHTIVDWAIYYVLRFLNINCYSFTEIHNCQRSFLVKNIIDSLDEKKEIQKIQLKNNFFISENLNIKKFKDVYEYKKINTPKYMKSHPYKNPSIKFTYFFMLKIYKQLIIDIKKLIYVKLKNINSSKNLKFSSGHYSIHKILKRISIINRGNKLPAPKNCLRKFNFHSNEFYIYIPLHFQPEASTELFGGIFIDQLLFIKSIRDLVPEKFKLLIKLNPLCRTPKSFIKLKEFWEAIFNMKNVFIFDENFPTKKLIKNSMAVASVAGTANFEANLLGKPSIYGGNSYYSDNPLSINLKDIKNSSQLIERINFINSLKDEKKETLIKEYIKINDSKSIPGFYHWEGDVPKKYKLKWLKEIFEEIITI
tara:strand:+ start:696 stop:2207 length:1512 start_codon:yes stop_codon:yes gene_type:complete